MDKLSRKEQIISLLQADPKDSFLLFAFAKELENEEDWIEAKKTYESILNNDESYVALYYHYGKLLERMLQIEEARKIYKEGLTEKEADNIQGFDLVFFEKNHPESNEETPSGNSALSPKAMRSALFIMLYRDFPVFQTSYQILDSLIEIDHQMAGWRHKHLVMVRRMIGMRTGTGGSSGAGYLEGALTKHNIFRDIEGLSTFLIERKKLPKLPEELIKKLSYSL